ncbi:MurR/RpiR family transcriptional regulator [Enterococcus hulanensis]|uniref:MurR/RpiR family transcriptional regulator n=1 Tax=Enterococcus hulanensis TaxID=2559929 RepID=A0ABU3EWT4_9ENTE|nr:MurR/RpiR family transcriptional regulator [Enterococcus hulanensis]MDT2598411.1 MurR/RpiR family transcriptional regulator [Enterococcus hulanensis]MDT2608084.1 MurR/RpiR family transcriptional regulator [Enterococcus hulanensis]MDT2615379.1 MurR/RpiR family transcriptional regulator [Enterococcus hulanensis]MDT2626650.1 MurR/RpiR family transcriptional regulator [Enterococcus hulanensis]MDT2654451.1 MurR/RpiR family transcriptional regulator [Enterococcus hulanensis]
MLLIDKLRLQKDLTTTEKRIADYILQNLTTIPAINVAELANNTYTSHSSVIRLAQKMGYDGFRDFRIAVSEIAHSELYRSNPVDANFPFLPQDSTNDIAKKIADLTINTVQRTYAQLSDQVLDETVDLLAKADRIFLFAQGDSQIRARSFQNKLVKINKFLIIADEYADEDWNAASLTSRDCAIFITYRARVPQYERMMKHFLNENIPAVLLTGNSQSNLIPLAAQAIVFTQEEMDFLKVSTFSSQVAFEYILDTLFSLLYAKEFQQNLAAFKKKNEWIENGILSDDPKT